MEESVAKLTEALKIGNDKRLEYFGVGMTRSNVSVHDSIWRNVRTLYGNSCLFCGATYNITRAHIVAANKNVDYSVFGRANGYKDELDVLSPRNYIPLCGSLGVNGSCHDAYDKHQIALMYNPFEQVYVLYCYGDSPKFRELHMKKIAISHDARPYHRLLSWRARKCAQEWGHLTQEDADILKMNKMSEDSHSKLAASESAEGEASVEEASADSVACVDDHDVADHGI